LGFGNPIFFNCFVVVLKILGLGEPQYLIVYKDLGVATPESKW